MKYWANANKKHEDFFNGEGVLRHCSSVENRFALLYDLFKCLRESTMIWIGQIQITVIEMDLHTKIMFIEPHNCQGLIGNKSEIKDMTRGSGWWIPQDAEHILFYRYEPSM